eukprot:GHVS01091015.1.p1 GENE.GHVS01091015.1~~GHVS01091015.1.p1  ORF type:complete len:1010 (-),score=115.67 GHVS01091015.1:587-3616(-)
MKIEGRVVQSVGCGREHAVLVLESGAAISFGTNEFGQLSHSPSVSIRQCQPRMMQGLANTPISQVACGSSFTLLLSRTGQVFSCGDSSQGCLGIDPKDLHIQPVARLIPTLVGLPIEELSCGLEHVLALTISGALYTWGSNRCGKLGHSKPHSQMDKAYTPMRIADLPYIKAVCAGGCHSLLIARGSAAYMCGDNTSGQLAVDPDRLAEVDHFYPVEALHGYKVKLAACGSHHTIVLTSEGSIRGFGRNVEGQLGLPLADSVYSPRTIDLDSPGVSLYAIAAGGDHSAAVGVLAAATPVRVPSDITHPYLRPPKLYRRLSSRLDSSTTLLYYSPPPLHPAGSSVDELLRLTESARSTGQDRELRTWLHDVMTAPHKLNCSFFFPGRRARFDVAGLDHLYEELFNLYKEPQKQELVQQLGVCFGNCLRSMEPFAQFVGAEEQVRFLLIILMCPLFQNTCLTDLCESVMTRLVKIMFLMPKQGREAFVGIIREDFAADILERRVLGHLKIFLNASLSTYRGHYRHVERVWHGIILLQLLYLACQPPSPSEDPASECDAEPKLPMESFVLSGIEEYVEPIKELELYVEQLRARGEAARGGGQLFHVASALTQQEVNPSWCFCLAHLNLCPVAFKRKVIVTDSLLKQHDLSFKSIINQSIPWFVLTVRRDHLVEDAMHYLVAVPRQERLKPMKVIFAGEQGVDEGGLKKELFALITKQLFNPNYGMFCYHEGIRTIWFNRNSLENDNEFLLIGLLVGLAIYNDILMDLPFPPVLYKKLLDVPTGLCDIADVLPEEAHSFRYLLSLDDESVFQDAFGEMTFEINYDYFGEMRTQPLVEGGGGIKLTMANRKEYVDLFVKYHLDDSITSQFDAFKKGFKDCESELINSLTASELQLIICGTRNYEFSDLREGASYDGGYTENSEYIKEFWDVCTSLDTHQKRKFLRFCTGSDRAPLGGLRALHLKVQRNGCEPVERLPTAYTCFNTLLLPEYGTQEKLRRLLVTAIENSEGFGLE